MKNNLFSNSMNFSQNNIKNNSLLDLINHKTTPVVSTDMDIAFIKNTVPISKENLGISDANLILSGEDFPENPLPGQTFRKNGVLYVWKDE